MRGLFQLPLSKEWSVSTKKSLALYGVLPVLAVSITKTTIVSSKTCAPSKDKPPMINSPAFSKGWQTAFAQQIAKASLN